ncbi:MAG: glycosyltransferase family 9 protein [Ignavibacteria bacterium]|nr:glycosyltransferase family 9 protein [Ignavibacteria bacterium]
MKRVLIVRTDRIGDVVMITPMAREIKRTFPDSFVATLTNPNTSAILENNPYVDKIITDDLKKESFRDVVREIKKYKFTDGLLVFPTARAAYQMFLGRIKNRIGVGRILYEVITLMKSVSRNNYIPLRHEADYCMDMARKIGIATDNIQPEIFITDEEKKWTENFYRDCGIDKSTYRIIIHTGSKNSAPNWSERKYFSLTEKILKTFPAENYALLFTALEMTDEFKAKIKSLNDKRIIDISNRIKDLRELIKVISGTDLMICSSTGPIHIADALDIRCIGIHCNRPMNCVKYWGVLNKKSVNLEVPKKYCEINCSEDKKICRFEDGISIDEVTEYININK